MYIVSKFDISGLQPPLPLHGISICTLQVNLLLLTNFGPYIQSVTAAADICLSITIL